MFHRIVVPYDGSKHSKKALKRATEVAHNLESEIFLITVVNVGYISPPGMLKGLIHSKTEKQAHKKWEKLATKDVEKMLVEVVSNCRKKGLSAKYFIAHGNVADEILKFSKKKKATIIIIGSRGLHGLAKLKSLGSVSRRVSELAHCPVLIVK